MPLRTFALALSLAACGPREAPPLVETSDAGSPLPSTPEFPTLEDLFRCPDGSPIPPSGVCTPDGGTP